VTPETDAQLVARVIAGDPEPYSELVGRYQASLFRYAAGMVRDGDLAADLVQDSFVKAYTSLETCNDPARFGAWVFRILVNRCKDHLKSRRRHTLPLEEDTATTPDSDDPGVYTDRADLRQLVERALATLPEAQREAFLLKHLEGRSYEEMSEMLDVSVSALKMRVLRAREALQSLLREFAD
jgi:RNA polymerase sigma-70 factor (ECF subfamily)